MKILYRSNMVRLAQHGMLRDKSQKKKDQNQEASNTSVKQNRSPSSPKFQGSPHILSGTFLLNSKE